MAVFKVLQGRELLASYSFDEGSVRIGRSPESEIQLNDGAVSRNHAEVSCKGSSWVLQIREARNGIFVNGNLVSFRLLRSGDRIEIAHFVIQFEDEGDANVDAGSPHLKGAEKELGKEVGENTTITISLSDALAIHKLNESVMEAHLAWYGDTEKQKICTLSNERTLIGSGESCGVQLPAGPGSEGDCAVVTRGEDSFELQPLSPSITVKVNASAVTGPVHLEDEDRIQIGNYIVQFREPLA